MIGCSAIRSLLLLFWPQVAHEVERATVCMTHRLNKAAATLTHKMRLHHIDGAVVTCSATEWLLLLMLLLPCCHAVMLLANANANAVPPGQTGAEGERSHRVCCIAGDAATLSRNAQY